MSEALTRSISLDNAWQALLATALLGTERQAPAAPELPAGLEDLLESASLAAGAGQPTHPANSDEARLLRRAASLALYRQAGSLPRRTTAPLVSACPPEEQSCGSLALNQILRRLMEEPNLPLWSEVLQAMAQAGLRLKETLLPRFLDQGARQPELGELLLPVLGEHGRWLAAQNPAWGYARLSDPDDTWQNGDRRARQRLLRQRRQADPAQARQMLSEVWALEDAETRAALLQTLEVKLGLDDEPFLEQALGDRALGVRRMAGDLLARLPASGLVQRMIARLQPLIRLDPGRWPLKKARLEIDLPESCTPEMVRDGVLPAPPKTWQGGEKAFWLGQMLQMVPPSWWCQTWKKTPAEWIELAEHSEWKTLLHESWVTAARRHRDVAWVLALRKHHPLRQSMGQALPPELIEALVRDLFHSKELAEAITLLMDHQSPWSPGFSHLVFDQIHRELLAYPTQPTAWQLHRQLLTLAYRLHPGMVRSIEQALNRPNSIGAGWEKFMEEFLYILTVRHQILEEIAHDRPAT